MYPARANELKTQILHSMTRGDSFNNNLNGGIALDQRERKKDGKLGQLPASAPLANPYVPFQLDNPPKYETRKALIRGTLYPGLDLPFHGMVNTKEKAVTPSTELQALGFAVHELALYLDTHPDDCEALQLYRKYQQLYNSTKTQYTNQRRPLNHMTVTDDEKYTWLCDPWPWEYAANKEV